MYGRKRYPSMYWLLVQAAIVFSYANLSYSKPYRQEIYQKDKNNNQEDNKTILHLTNNPSEHLAHLDKTVLDPSLNSQTQLSEKNKDSFKTNAGAPLLQESVIFKAIVSNANVLTLQEENSSSNGVLSKHPTESQEHKDANGSSSSHERPSKAHLKWDGHVVAAPLKYDPHASNFQTPKKVSDTISTSNMVLSLLTAAAALGSICMTVAIFQCCCRRKRTSDDEEDDDQIDTDQCNKEKASVKPVDTQEQQSVEPETSEKDVCIQKKDVPVETPTEQITTNGEAVQKDSEKKEEEEEQVSVKDKIKAFETQALKPFIAENVEQHRPLIKRPQSRVIADNTESEALSASTTLIMGQVFRKRADTEKCQRKEAASAPENTKTDDDYFGMIGRETEVLKSYRRAPAPRNRNKATKALYRKTMPIMDSGGKSKMDISMSDWEATVQSFQTESPSPLVKQESKKKKTAVRLPMANQKARDEVDNKQEEESSEASKTETKMEGSMMETVSVIDTEKVGSAPSTGNNTPDASSSGDEASQGEERKIKEEMKEESNKEEKEVEKVELKKEEVEEKEEELKEQFKKEKEEEKEEEGKEMKKEEEEKEKQKNEAEQKEKEEEKREKEEEKRVKVEEEKLKEVEEEKLKEKEEEKLKEEELNKEKKEKDEEPEKKEKQSKKEKEKLLKKEKELKREKDEVKREKEELNKEELKKGKEQLEKETDKNENIFFQIDPTAEPTAAKLVKRDSGHESSETGVQLRQRGDDSPKNDQSPKSKRHLSHLDRSTMFKLPGQKPEDQMSLMMSLKEKLNDKKEKNELDADTDTKMDVDPEPETEKSEVPEC